MTWFDVDKAGLGKILERRGKHFAIFELIQNAWDAIEESGQSGRVDVFLSSLIASKNAKIVVTDNNPDGFSDLSHAFTLFADTSKRGNPERRGRFNIGEKLVLALCEEACIKTTTGAVYFNKSGRQVNRFDKTNHGSEFSGTIRLNRSEVAEISSMVSSLLPPKNIETTFNGCLLDTREPLAEFEIQLPTEISDEEGYVRKTARKTMVQIFEPKSGELASLYEMGIPVVDTGDRYHVNVMQKIPLNTDRDNVTPSYLQTIRVAVLNQMHDKIEPDEANANWVRNASSDDRCGDKSITTILDHRFGEKRVAYDPSDPEANMKAVSLGYVVIKGRELSKQEWSNAKRANAVLPAGQVVSCKPKFSGFADAIAQENWTPGMRDVYDYAIRLAERVMNISLQVYFLNSGGSIKATYSRGNDELGILCFYVKSLGHRWFNLDNRDVDRLLIHELGHHYSSNHLSSDYHNALCKIGATMKYMALIDPDVFKPNAIA